MDLIKKNLEHRKKMPNPYSMFGGESRYEKWKETANKNEERVDVLDVSISDVQSEISQLEKQIEEHR